MKRIIALTATALLYASASFAAISISNSKHNLSTSGTGVRSTNQSQICIFCHTPHNATRNVPLWNRNDPATAPSAYKLYTSSNTLTAATKAAKLNSDSYSIFCLSCHDGTLAEIGSRVVRKGGVTINMIDSWGTWATTGLTNDGKSLTNDHPVGFDYTTAQSQNTADLYTVTQVNTAFNVPAGSSVFYKATTGNGNTSMECSSCHVVHDSTYSPFLRTTNSGSALCLACHKK